MWIHMWNHMCAYEFIYEFIYQNSLTGHFVWIHDMNSWHTWIHSFSWNHTRYDGLWPLVMWGIIFEMMSQEYREGYRDFIKFAKRIVLWIHWRVARMHRVWWGPGQAVLPLLLQSHLPHCQLVCLAELQCHYLPPWSYKLSHTQFWLPARLAPYQLESQLPRSDTDEEEVDPSQVPSRPNLSEKLIISVPGIFVIPFRPIF